MFLLLVDMHLGEQNLKTLVSQKMVQNLNFDPVALSILETEYTALSGAAQECICLRQLLSDLGKPTTGPTTLYEDNQFTFAMTKNPQFHRRAKHVHIMLLC